MGTTTTDTNSLDWEVVAARGTDDSGAATAAAAAAAAPLPSSGDVRFAGKVVVITGAGGQLGREGCCYFAARGAKLVALDLSAAALMETFQSCCSSTNSSTNTNTGSSTSCPGPEGSPSFDFKPYVCDVTNADAVEQVVSHVCASRFGRIDLLWNNAGYQGQITPILTMNPTDFSNVININVTGMFIVLQAVAKRMVAQGTGGGGGTTGGDCETVVEYAIVNTASVAGLRGTPAMAGYASSKAAVIALTVTAAKELAVHGIRCNAISPALIGPGALWERQNELHAAVGPPYFAATADQVAQAKIGQVPMKRLGTAAEVVASVAFLLSDDASYTTGINLTVDGGMAAGLKA